MTLYQLLPTLTPKEYADLRDDIRENGVVVPIIQDEHGNVLDGYHRLRVVAELRAEGVAIPDPPVVVRPGMSELDKIRLAVGLNVSRRHLTAFQRTKLGKQVEEAVREAAHDRQVSGLRNVQRPRSGKTSRTTEDPRGTSRDAVAETVGLGTGKTYEDNKRVISWVEAQADTDQTAADLLAKAERGEADMKHLRRYQRQAEAPRAPTETADMAGPASISDLKALDPNIQGRTPWYRVALVAKDFDTLTAWIYSTGNPDRINAFKKGTVNLIWPRPDVIAYRDDLTAAGYPGLASCFGAALEADADDVSDFGDLTSEERAVINRIRQTDTGIVEIRVAHGTPKVPPVRHWRWGDGKRRKESDA